MAVEAHTSEPSKMPPKQPMSGINVPEPAASGAPENNDQLQALAKIKTENENQYADAVRIGQATQRELTSLQRNSSFLHCFSVVFIALLFYLLVRYYLVCTTFDPLSVQDHLRFSDLSDHDIPNSPDISL